MENSFNEIIGNSLQKIKEFADAETVIGEPIVTANGTTVIPVSKVTMGFATGGLGSKQTDNKKPRMGGGGGTGVTVTPIAFLIVSASGKVDLMPISAPSGDGATTIDKVTSIIERSPDILARLKNVFTSDKKKAEKEEKAKESSEEAADAAE